MLDGGVVNYLSIGSYKDMSRVIVPPGWKMELFKETGLDGESKEFFNGHGGSMNLSSIKFLDSYSAYLE
jgi:hypothetical protein